jgi:phage-related protein
MTTSRSVRLPAERKLLWIGPSQDNTRAFPLPVVAKMLTGLEVARLGGKHEAAKPWKGEGPGIFEMAVEDGDAYRFVYTVRFKEVVYVLHAFQKKSTQGIKTPEREIETVRKRLKHATADYEVRYGKKRKR